MKSGDKTFEIRYNDREYQKGDLVKLNAFDGLYYDTSREPIYVEITYVSEHMQAGGWCVFGFKRVGVEDFDR